MATIRSARRRRRRLRLNLRLRLRLRLETTIDKQHPDKSSIWKRTSKRDLYRRFHRHVGDANF